MRKTMPNIQQWKFIIGEAYIGSKKGMQDSGLSFAFQLYYKGTPKA